MKILLTGGAGYIGSVTTKELIDRGHEVTVIDHLKEGHREAVDRRADFIEGNFADPKILKKAFSKHRHDAVVHFAASCIVPESLENPSLYYHNNVTSSLILLEAMCENKIPRIIFSSSCAVYGEPDEMPITENSPRNPTHPYGETKLTIERALKWYSRAYNIKAVSLRYFNAAGATDELGEDHAPETHLIPNVLRAALGHIPQVQVCGTDYLTKDGTCVRDYVHVLDIAEAHILALNHEESDSLNLGNGNGYSVLEVIQTAEKICGRKIPRKDVPRRPGDPPSLIASAKRIQDVLGWQPNYPTLEQIISSAWSWLENHPQGYGKKKKPSK